MTVTILKDGVETEVLYYTDTVRVNVGGEWKRVSSIQIKDGSDFESAIDFLPANISYIDDIEDFNNNATSYTSFTVKWKELDYRAPVDHYVIKLYTHSGPSTVVTDPPEQEHVLDAHGPARTTEGGSDYLTFQFTDLVKDQKYSIRVTPVSPAGVEGTEQNLYWQTGHPAVYTPTPYSRYNLNNKRTSVQVRGDGTSDGGLNWAYSADSDNATYPISNAFSNTSNVWISGTSKSTALNANAYGYSYWKAASSMSTGVTFRPLSAYRLVTRILFRIYGQVSASSPEFGWDIWDSATTVGFYRDPHGAVGWTQVGSAQAKPAAEAAWIASNAQYTNYPISFDFVWTGNWAVSPYNVDLKDTNGTTHDANYQFRMTQSGVTIPFVGGIYGGQHRATLSRVYIDYAPYEEVGSTDVLTTPQQDGFEWLKIV